MLVHIPWRRPLTQQQFYEWLVIGLAFWWDADMQAAPPATCVSLRCALRPPMFSTSKPMSGVLQVS